MSIEFRDISGRMPAFREELERFLGSLDTELAFMGRDLPIERILTSQVVLVAIEGSRRIIGVYGNRHKFGMTQEFIVIHRDFQGMRLGKELVERSHQVVRERPADKLLLAVVDCSNIKSLNLFRSAGYRKVGRRWELDYLLKPVNMRGVLLYYLVRMAFPFVNLLDRHR